MWPKGIRHAPRLVVFWSLAAGKNIEYQCGEPFSKCKKKPYKGAGFLFLIRSLLLLLFLRHGRDALKGLKIHQAASIVGDPMTYFTGSREFRQDY